MRSSSQKETYDSDTPSGSSRRTKSRSSIDGVLHLVFRHDRSSKEIIQSYQGFLSNSSVHTTTAAIHEDLLGVSEQDPFPPISSVPSNTRHSIISDDKSLYSLEKRAFGSPNRNQSPSTVSTIHRPHI